MQRKTAPHAQRLYALFASIGFVFVVGFLVSGSVACVDPNIPKTCSGNTDCSGERRYCVGGVCRFCIQDQDCGQGKRCQSNVCVDAPTTEPSGESTPTEPSSESTPTEPSGESTLPEEAISPEDGGSIENTPESPLPDEPKGPSCKPDPNDPTGMLRAHPKQTLLATQRPVWRT